MQNFEYWQNMPTLQKKLEKVQQIILQNIKNSKGKLWDALHFAFAVPGKELRPAFVILFGDMGQKNNDKRILHIASSIEVLHNATLIHDDIIDESKLRRGRSSIQAKFGKRIALYAGDFLFALSLQMLSNNTSKITNLRVNGKSMQDILAGETLQFDNEYNLNLSENDYLKQIKGKTGVLFGYSCFIGAIEGGLSYSLAKKAQKFGEKVGIAFQLRDDILDYTVSSKSLQKPVLNDVVNGVYTGPLIFAMKQDKEKKLEELVKIGKNLQPKELNEIDELVNQLGGITYTQRLADQYTSQALQMLKQYFNDYSSVNDLRTLVKKLLNRSY